MRRSLQAREASQQGERETPVVECVRYAVDRFARAAAARRWYDGAFLMCREGRFIWEDPQPTAPKQLCVTACMEAR
jgi:hypothetical protein